MITASQEVFNDLEAELTEELWSARIDEKKFVKEVSVPPCAATYCNVD